MKAADLDTFKVGGFPDDYPTNLRTFYSPVDDCHGVLGAVIDSATESLALAMYGLDDEDLVNRILAKLRDENIVVVLTLDSSQAGGVHERALLAQANFPKSIVVVGRSEKGAIMHMKELVVDGRIVVTGSTNWSTGGESKQDNQLTVIFDRAEAHAARTRIDAIHAHMLAKQPGLDARRPMTNPLVESIEPKEHER